MCLFPAVVRFAAEQYMSHWKNVVQVFMLPTSSHLMMGTVACVVL
jgi:hypothetical protein